ncbi:MAG: TraB/GumN family protein [Candidatus Nanohaloarchaea archaeon]|nr:TraB/GumN family protein [Candidatus Nanohaloarchaea archaeon]
MIRLIGTSHISQESVDDVASSIDDYNPAIVAVELDPRRFQALQQQRQADYSLRNPLISLIQYIQQHLSERTGITPGQELLTAAAEAERRGLPVALIDQDIAVTVQRLQQISVLEKFKLAGFLLIGMFLPGSGIDIDSVPDRDTIRELTTRLQVSFPGLYRVLLAERNKVMAARLIELEKEFGDVLAFVGAGHLDGIQNIIEEKTY